MTDGPTKSRRKPLPGLSRSDRQFLHCYATSKTLTEAAYKWAALRGVHIKTRDAAGQLGSRKFIRIRKTLAALGGEESLWEHLGLGLAGVARTLVEAMEATKTVPLMVNGKIVAAGPYPDHAARIAAATLAAKLRGDLPPRRPSAPPGEPNIFAFVVPKNEGEPV